MSNPASHRNYAVDCECASCTDKKEIDALKKIIDFQKYTIYSLDQSLQHLRAKLFMKENS